MRQIVEYFSNVFRHTAPPNHIGLRDSMKLALGKRNPSPGVPQAKPARQQIVATIPTICVTESFSGEWDSDEMHGFLSTFKDARAEKQVSPAKPKRQTKRTLTMHASIS